MSGVPPTENAESETGDERGRFVISPPSWPWATPVFRRGLPPVSKMHGFGENRPAVVGREARRVSCRAAWVVDSTPRLDRRPAARYPDTTRGIAPYNDFVNGQVLLWSQDGRMRRVGTTDGRDGVRPSKDSRQTDSTASGRGKSEM
jgi:hypothetical protein